MYPIAKHTPPPFYNGSLYANLICMEELRKKSMCTVESFPRIGIPPHFQKENADPKVQSTYLGNYLFLSTMVISSFVPISFVNTSFVASSYNIFT